MTKNEKISISLKLHFAKTGGSPLAGKPGHKHTNETKQKIAQGNKNRADKRGRVSEAHFKARNKANVYAYRARQQNAIPADANLKLIRTIYENCPSGYHVDHIIALASGGMHHQDNLQYLPISENCRKGKGDIYDKSLIIPWKSLYTMNT